MTINISVSNYPKEEAGSVALPFALAGGSTTGRDHRLGVPANCQDAYDIQATPKAITGLIADGCGSGKHSEVGAKLGVRMATVILHRYLAQGIEPSQEMLAQLKGELVSELRVISHLIGPNNLRQAIVDYFLFTLGGVIITEETALLFLLGDGVAIVNGEVIVVEPDEGNHPPYLGYALTGSAQTTFDSKTLSFKVIAKLPTQELQHFLIGTDGVQSILDNPNRQLPGRNDTVGDISGFWQNELFFHNPFALSRRLNLMARDWPRKIDSGERINDPGLLTDDIHATEVLLVKVVVDDSSSIGFENNTRNVIAGVNSLTKALQDSKAAGAILVSCQFLNHGTLYPFLPLSQALLLDDRNYQPNGGTPLYDMTAVALASVTAKMAELEDSGVAVRGVTYLVTDGADQGSRTHRTPQSVEPIIKGMLRTESHIIGAMGIDDGFTDFRAVFGAMGIPTQWIITPRNTASEIRAAFGTISQSAVRASQVAGSFSQGALGGFGN